MIPNDWILIVVDVVVVVVFAVLCLCFLCNRLRCSRRCFFIDDFWCSSLAATISAIVIHAIHQQIYLLSYRFVCLRIKCCGWFCNEKFILLLTNYLTLNYYYYYHLHKQITYVFSSEMWKKKNGKNDKNTIEWKGEEKKERKKKSIELKRIPLNWY